MGGKRGCHRRAAFSSRANCTAPGQLSHHVRAWAVRERARGRTLSVTRTSLARLAASNASPELCALSSLLTNRLHVRKVAGVLVQAGQAPRAALRLGGPAGGRGVDVGRAGGRRLRGRGRRRRLRGRPGRLGGGGGGRGAAHAAARGGEGHGVWLRVARRACDACARKRRECRVPGREREEEECEGGRRPPTGELCRPPAPAALPLAPTPPPPPPLQFTSFVAKHPKSMDPYLLNLFEWVS